MVFVFFSVLLRLRVSLSFFDTTSPPSPSSAPMSVSTATQPPHPQRASFPREQHRKRSETLARTWYQAPSRSRSLKKDCLHDICTIVSFDICAIVVDTDVPFLQQRRSHKQKLDAGLLSAGTAPPWGRNTGLNLVPGTVTVPITEKRLPAFDISAVSFVVIDTDSVSTTLIAAIPRAPPRGRRRKGAETLARTWLQLRRHGADHWKND